MRGPIGLPLQEAARSRVRRRILNYPYKRQYGGPGSVGRVTESRRISLGTEHLARCRATSFSSPSFVVKQSDFLLSKHASASDLTDSIEESAEMIESRGCLQYSLPAMTAESWDLGGSWASGL